MTSPLPRSPRSEVVLADRAEIRRCAPGPVVYRYFDGAGRLLYVGCTQNVAQRDWQHRSGGSGAFWFPIVTEIRIQEFPTIEEAREAEAVAICEEGPAYNTVGAGMRPGSRDKWSLEDHRLYKRWSKRPGNYAGWWAMAAVR